MAHSVSEAAARAVKNSERKAVETRTPEQRLADIRKNRQAKLFVTPDDQDFLLQLLDAVTATVTVYEKERQQMQFMLEECDRGLIQTRAERDDVAHQLAASAAQINGLQAQIAALQPPSEE